MAKATGGGKGGGRRGWGEFGTKYGGGRALEKMDEDGERLRIE